MKKKLLDIALHGIHSSGRAVGYCGTSRIYVDNGIPGELVDVEIDRIQRGYRYGKVVHASRPSFRRIQPFCVHYEVCGGCPWQHMVYEEQLHWKREIVRNALLKYSVETPTIPPVMPSPLLKGYRNKSEYTFAATTIDKQSQALGFHAAERRDAVFDTHECYLQTEGVQKAADVIKAEARRAGLPFYDYYTRDGILHSLQLRTTASGELSALLDITTANEQVLDWMKQLPYKCPDVTSFFYSVNRGEPIHYSGSFFLTEYSNGFYFRYGPSSFYQPNPLQAQNLCSQVKEYAGLSGKELVYDLYTGVGTLACHAAGAAGRVIGIEGNAQAIADAVYNASVNGISNVQFFVGDILSTFKDEFIAQYGRPDVVILDPPRSGTLIEIKKTLLRCAPQKIIYVSCNPVSLAFDLKQLCEAYYVAAIRPLDMFPHTHHVETIVLLERKRE